MKFLKVGHSSRGKSTADGDSAEYKGWLYKEGGGNKEFRRRFFVLNGTSLAYFAKEDDVAKGSSKGDLVASQIGHIHHQSKEAGVLETSTVPLTFYIDATSGRRFILFAETYADKVAWMQALASALGRPVGSTGKARLEAYLKSMTSSSGGEGASAPPPAPPPSPPSPAWDAIAEGVKLAGEGQAAAAQVTFDRALAGVPAGDVACEVCARYELGKFLVSRSQHKEASHHFAAALALGNQHSAGGQQQLRLQLAWCHGFTGEAIEAGLELYAAVLDDELFCAPAFLDRGKLYIRRHDWSKALGDLCHAAALGKADANVHNDIGTPPPHRPSSRSPLPCPPTLVPSCRVLLPSCPRTVVPSCPRALVPSCLPSSAPRDA